MLNLEIFLYYYILFIWVIRRKHLNSTVLRELESVLDQIDEDLLQTKLIPDKKPWQVFPVHRASIESIVFYHFVERVNGNYFIRKFCAFELRLYFKHFENKLYRSFWTKFIVFRLKNSLINHLRVQQIV